MFASTFSEGHRTIDSIDFRRSISAPALAKQRKLATQAFLRATETGDVTLLRRLALEAGAELGGSRALNRLGSDPVSLVNSSGHLTLEEQRRIRRQFAELPKLTSAAEAAVSPGQFPGTRPGTKQSNFSRPSTKQSMGTATSEVSSWTLRTTTPPALRSTSMSSALRTEMAMTGLTASVAGSAMQEEVCKAALTDPRLLKAPQELSSRAMAAMSKALKSEPLALEAVSRNPALLVVDALKFKKVLPVLIGIFGGKEMAAYAMSVQPDLLEVDRPQRLREALHATVDCLCSMKDALWLVVQTLLPTAVEVTARAWSREDAVGVYLRNEGEAADERPVYLKPASAMRHLGSKARDVYLRFSAPVADGGGAWLITPAVARKGVSDSRPSSKSAAVRAAQEDNDAIALALSKRISPDQVPGGLWSFKSKDSKAWTPDVTVSVVDTGRPRGPGLLTVDAVQLRKTFDSLREAVGICWRKANSDGKAPEDVVLRAVVVPGDSTHKGSEDSFTSLGAFTQETNGYSFLQLPVSFQASDSSPVVRLTAWEPICVTVIFCDVAPDAGKVKDPSSASDEPQERHILRVQSGGFRTPPEIPALPVLRGPYQPKEVLSRSFPRGPLELPLANGPGDKKLAPLIFVRAQVCALSARSGLPCELVKAKAKEILAYTPHGHNHRERAGEGLDSTSASIELPILQSGGDLVYNGYSLFRPPLGEDSCGPDEVLLRVEATERIQIVIAQFRLPAQQDTENAQQVSDAPTQQPPSPPSWITKEYWAPMESRIPLVLRTMSGELVTFEALYEKTFEGGTSVELHGYGERVVTVVFYRRVGDARPDLLRGLLRRKPSLLAAGDRVAKLHQGLRVELGEEVHAREVLMATINDWPGLCINGDEASIARWAFSRKAEALSREVQGAERAKVLLQHPDAASASMKRLSERCTVLREALGSRAAALDVLARHPHLLAAEANNLRSSRAALTGVLSPEGARSALRARPDFFLRGSEVTALFTLMQERFPELALQRLRDGTLTLKRPDSGWARWPDLVGKSREVVYEWLGRLAAEERNSRC